MTARRPGRSFSAARSCASLGRAGCRSPREMSWSGSALVGRPRRLGAVDRGRPAGQELQRLLGTRAGLGGVGEEPQPVVGGEVQPVEVQVELADDGLVEVLGTGVVEADDVASTQSRPARSRARAATARASRSRPPSASSPPRCSRASRLDTSAAPTTSPRPSPTSSATARRSSSGPISSSTAASCLAPEREAATGIARRRDRATSKHIHRVLRASAAPMPELRPAIGAIPWRRTYGRRATRPGRPTTSAAGRGRRAPTRAARSCG